MEAEAYGRYNAAAVLVVSSWLDSKSAGSAVIWLTNPGATSARALKPAQVEKAGFKSLLLS